MGTLVPLSLGLDRAPSRFAPGTILSACPTQVLLSWSACRQACAFRNVQSLSYWQSSQLRAIPPGGSPRMLCPGGSPWCNITCGRLALPVAVLQPVLLARMFTNVGCSLHLLQASALWHAFPDMSDPHMLMKQAGVWQMARTSVMVQRDTLATEFMRTVQLLNDTTEPCYCALHDAIQLVPPKDLDALPIAFQDSGGMGSIPQWSCPSQCKDNLLPSLRRWLGMLFELGSPRRLRLHTCPFSDSEIFSFRESFETLQSQKRISPFSWDVPSGQPCGPDALHSLRRLISTQDVALFPSLSVGVLTGYHHDIPASSVFATRRDDVQPRDKLQICERIGLVQEPTLHCF